MGLFPEPTPHVNYCPALLVISLFGAKFPQGHVTLPSNAHACIISICDYPLLHCQINNVFFERLPVKFVLPKLRQLLAFQSYFESCKFVKKISNTFLSLHAQNLFIIFSMINLPHISCCKDGGLDTGQWPPSSEDEIHGMRRKTCFLPLQSIPTATDTYTHSQTHICSHIYIHTHIHAHTGTYTHIMHTNIYLHTYTLTYTGEYILTCTHTNIHTYIPTHIHSHTNSNTHTQLSWCLTWAPSPLFVPLVNVLAP